MKKLSFILMIFALFMAKQSHAVCTATITAGGPTNFCDGSVTLLASSGQSYQWTIDGRTISGATSSSYVANASGTYACVVTATCGIATSNSIMVAAMFTPGLTQSINGPTSGICPNTNVMYAIGGLTGGFSYIWTVPTGVTVVSGQGTTNLTVRFPSGFAGGTISVKAQNGCGTGPAQSLAISSGGGLPALGAIQGTSYVCAQQTYTYSVAGITGATKYTWTVPSRAKILSGQGTQSITVKLSRSGGNVTVVASNSCFSSTASLPLTLTTNCGARLSNEDELETVVYPNPSNDYFKLNVAADDDTPYTLIVRDVTGRQLERRENMTPGETVVFGSDLAKGIYLAEILQGEERTVLRVVKNQ